MPTPEERPKYITALEVKKHDQRRSAWIIIRNEVYDVTPFINEHPGGEDPLLDAAGMDATLAFQDVGHSPDAIAMLKKFHVGTLAPGEYCSPYHYDCVECNASSCPNATVAPTTSYASVDKPWRTFDGTPSYHNVPMKTTYKPPHSPVIVRRVHAIVVPRERRGGLCRPLPPPPPPSSNMWKYAVAALGAAIVLGIIYKKYLAG